MILSKSYRILCLSLALLIFVSSSGLTMDIHYCQGDAKRVNLLGKAKTCTEVIRSGKSCHKESKASTTCGMQSDHKGCCDNKSFQFDMDFDYGDIIYVDITIDQIDFDHGIMHSHYYLTPFDKTNNLKNYIPPLLKQNISILFQCFLL